MERIQIEKEVGKATLKFMLERAHAMYSSTEKDNKVPKLGKESALMDGANNAALDSNPQRKNSHYSPEEARKVTSKNERDQTENEIINQMSDESEHTNKRVTK